MCCAAQNLVAASGSFRTLRFGVRTAFDEGYEERERRVRLGSADAPAESSRFSSYWDRLPPTSCPSACHSVQYFQPPQRKYRLGE